MPQLWSIYHVDNCRHITPKPKEKLVAIVGKDMSTYYGFFISTEMPKWVSNNSAARAFQVIILASEHKIDHDSYINCLKLHYFSEDELVNFRCALSNNAIIEIKKAVLNSKTIEKILIKLVLK